MFFQRHKVQKVRSLIAKAESIFVLTGAGISAASGIPTFRDSPKALWGNLDQMKYAFAETIRTDPEGVWHAHETARALIDDVKPNTAHEALVKLSYQKNVHLFTQNVDGLHGGLKEPAYELHGSIHDLVCTGHACEHAVRAPRKARLEQRMICEVCGMPMRHNTVLFGEEVRHYGKMIGALTKADLVLFIGTSGIVTDTKAICEAMKQLGVPVVDINTAMFTRVTFCADVIIRGHAEHVLHDLVA